MTTPFFEHRLDELISEGARSITKWSRLKHYSGAGHLSQDFFWSHAKHTLDISYRARPMEQYATLEDFFYVIFAGGYEGFRVKNWKDYELAQSNSTLQYNEDLSKWQINRVHKAFDIEYWREIFKPNDDVKIFRTRSSVVSEVPDPVVELTTGLVTFVGHMSGDTYTAEGTFDIPMTFVKDEWESNFRATAENLWLATSPILLEEIRLENI